MNVKDIIKKKIYKYLIVIFLLRSLKVFGNKIELEKVSNIENCVIVYIKI